MVYFKFVPVRVGETGWNVIQLTVANDENDPIIVGLTYSDGPADTIYLHGDYGVNISWRREEYNDLDILVFPGEGESDRYLLFLPKPGEYDIDVYYRAASDYRRRRWLGTIKIRVKGYPVVTGYIDPWSDIFNEKLNDKPRVDINIIDVVKLSGGKHLVYAEIIDHKEEKKYIFHYDSDRIVKTVGENVVLSPIAMQYILQTKARTGKNAAFIYDLEFKFDAFAEFFKNLFSGRFEPADEWFKHRIEDMVKKSLEANGFKNVYVSVQEIHLDYDLNGIILGYNREVKVHAKIFISIDLPAVPWWVVGVIIIGAIAAIIGYEVYLTIHDIEMTKQAYYNYLTEQAKAWEQYLDTYTEWFDYCKEHPEASVCRNPPEPPKLPEPKPPDKINIPGGAVEGAISTIGMIALLGIGAYVAVNVMGLFKKK